MEQARAEFFYQVLLDRGFHQSYKELLDIGCNDGRFLNLASQSWKTWGIDIDPALLEEAERLSPQSDFQLVDLDSQALPFADESFGVVTIFDVIEHLAAPHLALKEVSRVLKKGGAAVLVTPNSSSFTKALKGPSWVGVADLTHRYLFTPFTLKFLLERAGFSGIVTEALALTTQPLPGLLKSAVNKVLGMRGGQLWAVAYKNQHQVQGRD